MSKFIEVHIGSGEFKGCAVLVNLDAIEAVSEVNGTCGITIKGDVSILQESYYEVRAMIAKATGGIPVNYYNRSQESVIDIAMRLAKEYEEGK